MNNTHQPTLMSLFYEKALLLLTWGALIGIVALFTTRFYGLTMLVLASTIVTYILLGPVSILERGVHQLMVRLNQDHTQTLSRFIAVVVVYISFFSLIGSATVGLGPILVKQVHGFSKALPGYLTAAEDVVLSWRNTLATQWIMTPPTHTTPEPITTPSTKTTAKKEPTPKPATLTATPPPETPPIKTLVTEAEKTEFRESVVKQVLLQGLHSAKTGMGDGLRYIYNALTTTINGVLYVLSALIMVFYLLLDGHKLKPFIVNRLPAAAAVKANHLLEEAHQVMSTFIKGQFLLGLLTGSYMLIVYLLFDVKFAFLLASVFAVSEILPVVGTWIGFSPGILVMLFSDNPMVTIWVWLCSYCFQTIKDNILAPKVVGDVMGLHPVIVILSLLIGVKLAGLVGILIALPAASILGIILKHRRQERFTATVSPESLFHDH